ncbi:MAG TPA: MDR family oxidoreductase [Methylomirabilota bacterium]|jgi:acrylyl-CoA reductase (NADPH)|nr:MDR family oxidoreductase [Methylomirabilota bacterium]
MSFTALMLEERDGKVRAGLQQVEDGALPDGDVTVRISHSTLNYKDGLILNGLGRLVRKYPHVPGIDFAGVVEESTHPEWKRGDKVILTGWRVGEMQWGGYAEKARVKGDWLVRLPQGLTPARAMAVGTAGFTAALAVAALERHGLAPGAGEVAVTGAAGGLGSVAVALLARGGHRVTASTGRAETHGYLRELGATSIIDRAELAQASDKPLLGERWAGAVDSVGGSTLASLLAGMRYRSSVATCGLAGGSKLETTVIPFIIRGVNLLGIDSVMAPMAERREAWSRIVRDLPMELLDRMTTTVGLKDLPELGARILKGNVQGRVVVEI